MDAFCGNGKATPKTDDTGRRILRGESSGVRTGERELCLNIGMTGQFMAYKNRRENTSGTRESGST